MMLILETDIKNKIKSNFETIVQLVKYFFVGAGASMVDMSVFTSLTYVAKMDCLLAVFLSFTAGTLTNFILSNLFVFDRKKRSILKVCIKHYISSLGGLATNELVVFMLYEIIHLKSLFFIKCLATVSGFFVNFTLIKLYAFNSNKSKIGPFVKKSTKQKESMLWKY